jgi:hypothetical protein
MTFKNIRIEGIDVHKVGTKYTKVNPKYQIFLTFV